MPRRYAGIQAESDGTHEAWNEAAQAAWIDSVVPVLMAKQAVVGIFWTHFCDGTPHDYPHAGLLRPDGSPKPAFERLQAQRRAFSKTESESSQDDA